MTTVIGPTVSGPAGTVAVICEFESTVKAALRSLKFVPLMTTAWPGAIAVGENAEIVGGVVIPNEYWLKLLMFETMTLNWPEVAPTGTVAVILLAELIVKGTAAPLS